MRRFILTVFALAAVSFSVAAQDLNQITEIYNNGATALSNGEKEPAVQYFQEALSLAQALGGDGEEIVAKCKEIIPELVVSIAKDLIKGGSYDAATAKLAEAAKLAKEYGNEELASEAQGMIPQVFMQQGATLINARKFAEAAEAYRKVLAGDSTNGMAALRLGMALAQSGKLDEAVEAYKQASANGQEKQALKQLSTVFLKKAATALKAKDYAGALASAVESNSYLESAQAYQIAGQCSQLLKKESDAIGYFEKYLELKPDARNAGQIAYTVAALYHKAGNKDKAIEFYQKASTDPTYGAEALKMAASLKK